jgi:hypothetical protein
MSEHHLDALFTVLGCHPPEPGFGREQAPDGPAVPGFVQPPGAGRVGERRPPVARENEFLAVPETSHTFVPPDPLTAPGTEEERERSERRRQLEIAGWDGGAGRHRGGQHRPS